MTAHEFQSSRPQKEMLSQEEWVAQSAALLVACLPSLHEALGSVLAPPKLGVGIHTCNPSTPEVGDQQ